MITLPQAYAALRAAEEKAAAIGVPVNIAILDAAAHLKAFSRMDGAVLGSIDVATRKATTAALFQARSEAVWEHCKPGAPAPALELSNGGLAPFDSNIHGSHLRRGDLGGARQADEPAARGQHDVDAAREEGAVLRP